MNIDVRKAERSDADVISVLNLEVQSKHVQAISWLFKDLPLGPDSAKALLNGERNLVFLASADGAPAGYIYVEFRGFPETPLTWAFTALHIHHIAVAKKFRRYGVARALMQRVITAGKDRKIDRLTADYWVFNEEAARFFESFGLQVYIHRAWRRLDNGGDLEGS